MKGFNKQLGDKGEQFAADYLVSLGYTIIERNARMHHGEIDIIAQDKGELIFVEVKTRSSTAFGDPFDAIKYKKKKHFKSAVGEWLRRYGKGRDARYDLIGIVANGTAIPDLSHIKDATL